MNYQPFLEMNVLLSDPMLQAVQDNKFVLIGFCLAVFYMLVALHFVVLIFAVEFVSNLRSRPPSANAQKD